MAENVIDEVIRTTRDLLIAAKVIADAARPMRADVVALRLERQHMRAWAVASRMTRPPENPTGPRHLLN